MRFVVATHKLRRHSWLGYPAALVLFVAAFGLRYVFGHNLANVPFMTFVPAMVFAALLGGVRAGILTALLGGVASWYYFVTPFNAFVLAWPWGIVALALYVLTAAVLLSVIHALNCTVDELTLERDRSAALFHEFQHRTANNMTFLAALLRMQRRRIADQASPAALALAETERRLATMSRIHRRLYDPSMADIPVGPWFEELCTDLLEATGAKNIVCLVQTPEVRFDVKRLTTLSLLVAEVVTNSLKHAFVDGETGTIKIKLEQVGTRYKLAISDDGRGLPDGLSPSKSTGLGLRIIESLAEQLGGEIRRVGGAGTTTTLTFPA